MECLRLTSVNITLLVWVAVFQGRWLMVESAKPTLLYLYGGISCGYGFKGLSPVMAVSYRNFLRCYRSHLYTELS